MANGKDRGGVCGGGDMESVLAEQRRQIVLAESLNSDLDFVYNLQLQEAMAASLALLPCSSSSPAPRASPQPPIQNDDGAGPGGFDYLALLVQDLDRLDQENKDREASEDLMRGTVENLDRQIHDRNFAREIMNVPDPEWEEHGDDIETPYGPKAKGAAFEAERFKLYCKGVVSEERIRDTTVTVAGIGVAICDSRDNGVFEVSKKLDVGGGCGGGDGWFKELAEMEGLVEGLNLALDLDLKMVTVFCDDYMLYQYVKYGVNQMQVRERVSAVAQSKLSTLTNKVSALQKKFTDCTPSLVARNDLKFAFKLARDAIVSQITWPEGTGKGKSMMTYKETCVICYEDKDVDQMFTVDGCLHRYCFSCMKQHVEVKLLNGVNSKCPHEGCDSEVSIDACGKFVDQKLVDIVSQRKKEVSIAVTLRVYCPYKECSAVMSKSEVLEYTKTYCNVAAENSGERKCVKCHRIFCIDCKVPWHSVLTCDEYKRRSRHPTSEDAMLDNLAKRKRWRQCVKCSNMVELASGCYHITCRCGYEFCYTCGAEWKKKKPTCRCRLWDESNIINDRPRGRARQA